MELLCDGIVLASHNNVRRTNISRKSILSAIGHIAWIRIRFSNFFGSESGFQIFERLDLDSDPICPERLDPDPVNIRPDPKPCTAEIKLMWSTSMIDLIPRLNGLYFLSSKP